MITRTYTNPIETANAQSAKELSVQVFFVTLTFIGMAVMLAMFANVLA